MHHGIVTEAALNEAHDALTDARLLAAVIQSLPETYWCDNFKPVERTAMHMLRKGIEPYGEEIENENSDEESGEGTFALFPINVIDGVEVERIDTEGAASDLDENGNGGQDGTGGGNGSPGIVDAGRSTADFLDEWRPTVC